MPVLSGGKPAGTMQEGHNIGNRRRERENELGRVLLGRLKRQEVLVNFKGQDSVAFERASLDSDNS